MDQKYNYCVGILINLAPEKGHIACRDRIFRVKLYLKIDLNQCLFVEDDLVVGPYFVNRCQNSP